MGLAAAADRSTASTNCTAALAQSADEPGPWMIVGEGRRLDADDQAAARLRLHQAAVHGGDRLRRVGHDGRRCMSSRRGARALSPRWPHCRRFDRHRPRAARARAAPPFSTPSASCWPARRSRPVAPCRSRRADDGGPRARCWAPASAPAQRMPRSPTAPPRTRSITTTCASCRSRTRARRSCRRFSRPASCAGASGPALARRLRRRLRDRSTAWPADEPSSLPARLALHVDAGRHRCGRGRQPRSSASTAARPPTRSPSPPQRRRGSRRTSARW